MTLLVDWPLAVISRFCWDTTGFQERSSPTQDIPSGNLRYCKRNGVKFQCTFFIVLTVCLLRNLLMADILMSTERPQRTEFDLTGCSEWPLYKQIVSGAWVSNHISSYYRCFLVLWQPFRF